MTITRAAVIPPRALSIRQPWAYPVVLGVKRCENRSRGALGWSYRGRLLIHAPVGWAERGATDPRVVELLKGRDELAARRTLDMPDAFAVHPGRSELDRGGIIGVATLVDVHVGLGCCAEAWGEDTYPNSAGEQVTEVVHLLLEDACPLPLVPCPGALGLWGTDRLADTARETLAERMTDAGLTE